MSLRLVIKNKVNEKEIKALNQKLNAYDNENKELKLHLTEIKKAVLKKLFELSPIEQKQIKEHQFVNDLSPYVWSKDNKNRMINRKLLSHHSIYLSKHNRFASSRLHSSVNIFTTSCRCFSINSFMISCSMQ